MNRFQVLNGPEEGRVAEFGAGTFLVGRHSSADLVLSGAAVSGRHLELVIGEDGRVRFRDLGSTNGTWSGGLKVQEGEWFPGTELRLGDIRLRLLDPADAAPPEAGGGEPAAAAADRDLHERAVREALSGRRRGGPLVFVLLLAAIAAATWFLLPRLDDGAGAESAAAPAAPAGGGPAAGPNDLLGGLGAFDSESAASWQLGPGLSIADGALRAAGPAPARAVLATRIEPAACTLVFQAETGGGRVWPLVEFGPEDGDRAAAVWSGPDLGAAASSITLPCDRAGWCRVGLRLEPGATVRALRVEEGEAKAAAERPQVGWEVVAAGANLILNRQGERLFDAAGAAGDWRASPDGLSFQAGGDWLRLAPGPDQTLLALVEGGPPVEARAGGELPAVTGLLLRGSTRLWARFEQPAAAFSGPDGLFFPDPPSFRFTWRLDEALAEAARLDRAVRRAAQEGDTAGLLAAARELLFAWPVDEQEVAAAEAARDAAIAAGREEFARLEQEVAEAIFLAAEGEMRRLQRTAAELAARFPGTDLEREAQEMAAVLGSEADRLGEDRRERAAAYRSRLLSALRRAYPALAAWLES
ncbi:MAG: FHA domain-containing protein [Planctomycetota bacterium]|nr:MAG: FHA domain-containing protein [Planctomycetota bacterium]